jgi:hypothetical protein
MGERLREVSQQLGGLRIRLSMDAPGWRVACII